MKRPVKSAASAARVSPRARRQGTYLDALGRLTGGMAHEFNNLLTVVRGNLESAGSKANDPSVQRAIDRAADAAEKATSLIAQLVAFSRRQRLDSRPLDLNALAREVDQEISPSLGAEFELRLDLTPALRAVEADANAVRSALLNLLTNAREAMASGGRIIVATQNESVDPQLAAENEGLVVGEYAVLSIRDTGGGIPSEIIDRVVDPFFTTKAVGEGAGMGLASVYGFMRQSCGKLSIRSLGTVGTEVKLYFLATGNVTSAEPLAGDEDASKAGRESSKAGRESSKAGRESSNTGRESSNTGRESSNTGRESILIVEDNADVAEVAAIFLGRIGYRLHQASTAAEALDVLDREPEIDLLFTDIMMPGHMNGISLALEARRRHPSLRTLLTTGWSTELADRGHGRVPFEVLGKPYSREQLLSTVRRLLDLPSAT